MQETIYTIGGARLNKNEIDILCGMPETPETITNIIHVSELSDPLAAEDAVHHLILEGLLEWTYVGETVRVSDETYEWFDTHGETLAGLSLMLNTDMFELDEMAVA